jgi:hypothetical protein
MFLNFLRRAAHAVVAAWRDFVDRWIPCLFSSSKEVVFTLLVSNGALFVALFCHYVDTKGEQPNVASAVQLIFAEIKTTEVLAYVLAILAAPLWIMVSRWRASRHANFFFTLYIVQWIMVAGSAYIFARARSPEGVANEFFVNRWALWCFAASVAIWFVTLTYQKLVLEASNETLASPSTSGQSGEAMLDELRGGK